MVESGAKPRRRTMDRKEPVQNKVMPDPVLGSTNTEQKSPTEPKIGLRRLKALWPWAWIALTGVATLGWLIGIGWSAVALARWFAD